MHAACCCGNSTVVIKRAETAKRRLVRATAACMHGGQDTTRYDSTTINDHRSTAAVINSATPRSALCAPDRCSVSAAVTGHFSPAPPPPICPLVKRVKVAHSRLSSVGSRSWSRFSAVSLQVTWVINPAVGCHYFPPAHLQILFMDTCRQCCLRSVVGRNRDPNLCKLARHGPWLVRKRFTRDH